MDNVFTIFKLLQPNIEKNKDNFIKLITNEYNDIQYIKTTNMSHNYLFNDTISSKFYHYLGLTKGDLKKLIQKYIHSTSNFDSLDPNNIMLLCLLRYFKNNHSSKYTMIVFEILFYKLYYPIFTQYFKYGIDDSAFEYFTTTLSQKYDVAKYDSIYKAIDSKMHTTYETYNSYITSNDEKNFLLIPVNIKTRLNQFLKNIMSEYKPFVKVNKVHLNSSKDIETEDGLFNTQTSNNNSVIEVYKNNLKYALLHDNIQDSVKHNLLKLFKKSDIHDIEAIYDIVKHKEDINTLADLFTHNMGLNNNIESSNLIKGMFDQLFKYKDNTFTKEVDTILFKHIPNYKNLEKTKLIDKRQILIFILYLFLLKGVKNKS